MNKGPTKLLGPVAHILIASNSHVVHHLVHNPPDLALFKTWWRHGGANRSKEQWLIPADRYDDMSPRGVLCLAFQDLGRKRVGWLKALATVKQCAK